MITRDDAERLRARLREALREDARNAERILSRVGSLAHEAGIGPYAAVLLALTRCSFDESEARRHGTRASLAPGFVLSGLGQYTDALLRADRVVTFGA